jgi:hypothetical protein
MFMVDSRWTDCRKGRVRNAVESLKTGIPARGDDALRAPCGKARAIHLETP